MTKVVNGTPVSAPLCAGTDTANTWPTHLASLGAGGFEVVDTIAERDAISAERRDKKAVLVLNGTSGKAELYMYKGLWAIQPIPAGLTISDGTDSYNDIKEVEFNGCVVTTDGAGKAIVTVKATSGSGGANSGIIVDDGVTSAGGVTSITTDSMEVTVDPTNNHNIKLTPVISFSGVSTATSEEKVLPTGAKANEVNVLPPLRVFSDPNKQLGAVIEIDHSVFANKDIGLLAYLSEDEQMIGRPVNGVRQGVLYFTDTVYPKGSYIQADPEYKRYGIQEEDSKDPNVTGGTPHLLAYRIALKGQAPADGYVSIYLRDPVSKNILTDSEGNKIGARKDYKQGEALGLLQATTILAAKGLQYFQCVVEDNFNDTPLTVLNRTEGASGLMIQALEGDRKTGTALQQFEIDTEQNLLFTSHSFGSNLFKMKWLLDRDLPEESGTEFADQKIDSSIAYNANANSLVSISKGQINVKSSGSDMLMFTLGTVLSAEKTRMLRGKELTIVAEIVNPNGGFNILGASWKGAADKYTESIITGSSNGSLNFAQDWSTSGSPLFIAENIKGTVGMVSGKITVPDDAVNFAIVVAPEEEENPVNLGVQDLEIDVIPAFTGHVIKAPKIGDKLK